ncbi:hypothetical protein GCM10007159_02610 [Modicisalibacter luteus]|nr:hypothetical protein GCM10007159_02610 [Halomonas lutea]
MARNYFKNDWYINHVIKLDFVVLDSGRNTGWGSIRLSLVIKREMTAPFPAWEKDELDGLGMRSSGRVDFVYRLR